MKMCWQQILHDYVSLISALTGVLVGFGIQVWYKKLGSLDIFFYNDVVALFSYDNISRSKMNAKNIDAAEHGELSIAVDMYNSKDIPLGLRNIHFKIDKDQLCINYLSREMHQPSKLTFLNIPPKQFISFAVQTCLSKEQIDKVYTNKCKIKFVAMDQDQKIVVKEILLDKTIK